MHSVLNNLNFGGLQCHRATSQISFSFLLTLLWPRHLPGHAYSAYVAVCDTVLDCPRRARTIPRPASQDRPISLVIHGKAELPTTCIRRFSKMYSVRRVIQREPMKREIMRWPFDRSFFQIGVMFLKKFPVCQGFVVSFGYGINLEGRIAR